MKTYLTIIGLLIISSSTFASTSEVLKLPLSGDRTSNDRPAFNFKKPLVIPFNLLTEKQVQHIEAQDSNAKFGFIVTFIDGKPTRLEYPLNTSLVNQRTTRQLSA